MALTKATNRMTSGGVTNVMDFGAVGDGVTDDSAAIQAAIDYLFLTDKNTVFFPDGIFLLDTPVVVSFDTTGGDTFKYARALRMVGTSSAGFVYVRPGGTRIIGGDGVMDALFLLTNSAINQAGGYSFEVENIDFHGNGKKTGSAIKNIVGGGPQRPFNVKSCNFHQFEKAIFSDSTAVEPGSGTGLCQVNIHGSNFNANTYGLYGKGAYAIMDLVFSGNVCEQNGLAGIYTEAGCLGGGVIISDNLLEGQISPIHIGTTRGSGTIERNYFESHVDDELITIACLSTDTFFTIKDNYYSSVTGAKVTLSGGTFKVHDDLERHGIKTDYANTKPTTSAPLLKGYYTPAAAGKVFYTDLASVSTQSALPALATDAEFLTGGGSSQFITAPMGSYMAVAPHSGTGTRYTYNVAVAAGDIVVVTTLVKITGNPTIAVYMLNATNNPISNVQSLGFRAGLGTAEFFVMTATFLVPSTEALIKFRFAVTGGTGTLQHSSFYCYKLAAADFTLGDTKLTSMYPTNHPERYYVAHDVPSVAAGATYTFDLAEPSVKVADLVLASTTFAATGDLLIEAYIPSDGVIRFLFTNKGGVAVDPANTNVWALIQKLY